MEVSRIGPVSIAIGVISLPHGGDLRVDQLAHELGRQPGILIGVLDADRLAVDDGQLVAELVADVALVADLAHRPDEVAVVAVRLLADDPVVALEAADRPVGPALELAAEVR